MINVKVTVLHSKLNEIGQMAEYNMTVIKLISI